MRKPLFRHTATRKGLAMLNQHAVTILLVFPALSSHSAWLAIKGVGGAEVQHRWPTKTQVIRCRTHYKSHPPLPSLGHA